MNEQEKIIFEPIEVTQSDLIDISEADYKDLMQAQNEALFELMQELERLTC